MAQHLSKRDIYRIFTSNGFKIKEGQRDLADYVYTAAQALLKAHEALNNPSATPSPELPIIPKGLDDDLGVVAFNDFLSSTSHWLSRFTRGHHRLQSSDNRMFRFTESQPDWITLSNSCTITTSSLRGLRADVRVIFRKSDIVRITKRGQLVGCFVREGASSIPPSSQEVTSSLIDLPYFLASPGRCLKRLAGMDCALKAGEDRLFRFSKFVPMQAKPTETWVTSFSGFLGSRAHTKEMLRKHDVVKVYKHKELFGCLVLEGRFC